MPPDPRVDLRGTAAGAELTGQVCAILLVLYVMFEPRWASLELFYLGFIPIIWIAMRQGTRRVTIGLLQLNFGVVAAMHVFPPSRGLLTKVGGRSCWSYRLSV